MKNKYVFPLRKQGTGSRSCIARALIIFLSVLSVYLLNPVDFVHAAPVSPVALTVYGQNGSFTSNTPNNGGVSASSLDNPRRLALDAAGGLYVSDNNNNRVLYFPAGSTTATRVYGQNGSFTSNVSNNGGISANSLSQPRGLALDTGGNLYVADFANNRVLYFPAGSTTATRVYGQNGSFISNVPNNGGITANSLYGPIGLGIDSANNLYVTDTNNNRVLFYPAGSTTATRVYGQNGSFTSNIPNNGGISASSLYAPVAVGLDSSNNLYVADEGNNRVLYFPAGSTTATRVYGQNGSFTSSLSNNGGISATSLNQPYGFALDSNNNLYLADLGNNRVLYFPAGSTTATRVYGQGGSFTTGLANMGAATPSATTLNAALGLAVDTNGNIYIADNSNNRVLRFQTALRITKQPPASTPVNTTFSIASSLVDVGSGGVFTDFNGPVTVVIQPGTGTAGATLHGTLTVNAVNGVATFNNLSIDTAGTGYVLITSSPGVGSGNTNPFTVTGPLLLIPLSTPSFTVTLTGAPTSVTSQVQFEVSDTTYSGVGWHMQVTSTQFTSTSGATLPTNATAITNVTSACTSGSSCVLPVNNVSYASFIVPAGNPPPPAVTFFDAAPGTGTGNVTLTITLQLTVPPGTAAGTYTSDFTYSLIKGQ